MSSINPKELYLRIVTQRGTRTLCHDIVVCCGEEELTDELCERKRLEIVACMQEELEPGEKIVSAEYVSKDSHARRPRQRQGRAVAYHGFHCLRSLVCFR